MRLFAYELLYRDADQRSACAIGGDSATSQVIVNTFLEIGFENLVGDNYAFLNLTRNFLVHNDLKILSPEHVVLEVLEDVAMDEQLLASLKDFSKRGFLIALDDFIYREELTPLVSAADIIKIDVMDLGKKRVLEDVSRLRDCKARLLAEKVETKEDYHYCRDLGFDYFQGYFFARPSLVTSRSLPANKAAVLQLLSRINDECAAIDDVATLISQDPSLSLKFLRGVNSPLNRRTSKVESIAQAVTLLGLDQVRNWASLMAMADVDGAPAELLTTLLVRARLCQSIGASLGLPNDSCFTVGLFSGLDAVMDMSMKDLLENLPLSEDVNGALLYNSGSYAATLELAMKLEKGRAGERAELGIDGGELTAAYIDAVQWADQLTRSVSR